MSGSGLIGFLQILKGWKAEGLGPSSSGACEREPPPIRGRAKDIIRRWPVFCMALKWGLPVAVWRPITKKDTVSPFCCSRL